MLECIASQSYGWLHAQILLTAFMDADLHNVNVGVPDFPTYVSDLFDGASGTDMHGCATHIMAYGVTMAACISDLCYAMEDEVLCQKDADLFGFLYLIPKKLFSLFLQSMQPTMWIFIEMFLCA